MIMLKYYCYKCQDYVAQCQHYFTKEEMPVQNNGLVIPIHKFLSEDKKLCSYAYSKSKVNKYRPPKEIICCGFILWDKDEACMWGGPWKDIGVFVKILDFTGKNHLRSLAEIQTNYYEPSIELPVKFYMAGNDDCSYVALFPNKDSAIQALKEIKRNPVKATMDSYNFKRIT